MYSNVALTASVVYLIIVLGLMILQIVAMWKLFAKAGEPGWAAIVPFYNSWVLFKITWGSGAYMFLLFLPVGNMIVMFATLFKLASSYGKGVGYGFGLIFFSAIMLPVLAFSRSEYKGPSGNNKGVIIASIIISVLYFLACIVAVGALVASGLVDETTNKNNIGVSGYVEERNKVDVSEDVENDVDGDASPVTEGFRTVTIDNTDASLTVEVLEGENTSVEGAYALSDSDGISLNVSMDYVTMEEDGTTLQDILTDEVETYTSTLNEMSFYTDISTGAVQETDNGVFQRIDYTYDLGEETYNNSVYVRISECNGYAVKTIVEVDYSNATKKTGDLLSAICDKYKLLASVG